MIHVYIASEEDKSILKLIEYTGNYTFIVLKWIESADDGYPDDLPELEDKVFASNIEVMFADLPVLTKDRKNLVNLKWVHTAWNGVDILMKSFEKDEYVIGYIIANERRFFLAKESQLKSKWEQVINDSRRTLSSLTIGILGVGEIGQRRKIVSKQHMKTTDQLEELLENCDYICNILPSIPLTKDLLSGDVLEKCKAKKSVFIIVGRGDVVDEQSIVKAINKGWLRGAILDVFPDEPLPSSSPLWGLPGVIITPHVAGWSTDDSASDRVLSCFVDNLNYYVEGQPLNGALDWSQGYQKSRILN